MFVSVALPATHRNRDGSFQRFHDSREKLLPWIEEYSPLTHVSPDDPPVFLEYPAQKKPPVKGVRGARPRPSRPSSPEVQDFRRLLDRAIDGGVALTRSGTFWPRCTFLWNHR